MSKLYRPEVELIVTGCVLIFVFGILMAGIVDAVQRDALGWAWAFIVGETICFLAYFKVISDLLDWLVGDSDDVAWVDCDVDCKHDGHDYTGDDHRPGDN